MLRLWGRKTAGPIDVPRKPEKLACKPYVGLLAVLVIAVALPSHTRADVPPGQVAEVEHLLAFIKNNSSCRFLRNGREYSGTRAHRHVLRKYDYFRDQIRSTEDFIALSASESTISGKPYQFLCQGSPAVESKTALLEELARYRSSRS